MLRSLTQQHGALLIMDEVVTGFRYAPGGCQEYYGIAPDISTFGKALGAGFPVGAVAGPRAILDRMRWSEHMVLHYGTFNGHRLTMKVIAANLDLLAAAGTYQKLHDVGNAAISGLREVFRHHKIKAIVQGFGPMFQIYFTERDAIHDYRDYCTYVDTKLYSRFVHRLLERGIYMTPSNGLHWIISTAHTEKDVATMIKAEPPRSKTKKKTMPLPPGGSIPSSLLPLRSTTTLSSTSPSPLPQTIQLTHLPRRTHSSHPLAGIPYSPAPPILLPLASPPPVPPSPSFPGSPPPPTHPSSLFTLLSSPPRHHAAHALADGILAWRESNISLDELLQEAATPGGIAAATLASMDKSGYKHVVEQGLQAGMNQATKNAKR